MSLLGRLRAQDTDRLDGQPRRDTRKKLAGGDLMGASLDLVQWWHLANQYAHAAGRLYHNQFQLLRRQ